MTTYDAAHLDDPRYEPVLVQASKDTAFRVTWADDHVTEQDLVETRIACPCAACNGVREQGGVVWPSPGAPEELDVVGAELVGAWGVTLHWNDGHQTGIYPWRMLRDGCRCEECSAAQISP